MTTKKYGGFKDLVERGFVKNRMQEYRNRGRGAPLPKEYGPNSLIWDLEAYAEYLENLPRRAPGSKKFPGSAGQIHKRAEAPYPPRMTRLRSPPESRRPLRHDRKTRSPAAGGRGPGSRNVMRRG
jgi:hypothetical protein